LLQAGIFLSPIGPEGMAVRDNWNWSRSNLFFGLPFYHTGARITYPITNEWAVMLAGYNGWNSVVDGNDEKSISAQVTYNRPDKLALSVLYFGGVERPKGAPEGPAWRHLFDLHATWQANAWLSLIGHLNGGTDLCSFSRFFQTLFRNSRRCFPRTCTCEHRRGSVFHLLAGALGFFGNGNG
jgi:hypothetical protein